MPGRLFCGTTGFNKSYLAIAWNARHDLTNSERRGFAQFFYLTMSGHVESVLSKIMEARLISVQHLNLQSPLFHSAEGTQASDCDLPVHDSLLGIVSSLRSEVEIAPLGKLMTLHKRIFQKSLQDVIGRELYEDLNALGALRNTMAHGRDLYLEFDEARSKPNELGGPITLDGNPLKKAAERLKIAGISNICVSDIDTLNWDEFFADFYCDDALLYFYKAVIQIEDRLRSSSNYPPEAMLSYVPPLPNLI